VVRGERRGQWRPHVARIAEAMQHDDPGPVPAKPDVDRGAISLDLGRAEAGRESRYSGHGIHTIG
jgi:hypothetical protein